MSQKPGTLRPQAPPAPQVTASAKRPGAGCRGTEGIENVEHFLKGLAFFEIRTWWLSKSCRPPSERRPLPGHPGQRAGKKSGPCLIMAVRAASLNSKAHPPATVSPKITLPHLLKKHFTLYRLSPPPGTSSCEIPVPLTFLLGWGSK